MSVYATISTPPSEFILADTLETHTDVHAELERVVPLGRRTEVTLWVDDDPAWIRRASETDSNVAQVDVLEAVNDERLVRIRRAEPENDLVDALVAAEATCLSGVASEGMWTLTLRFPSSTQLTEWYRWCVDTDVSVEVRSVQRSRRVNRPETVSRLTDAQHETLRTALEGGYFAIPRKVTLAELADQLGISDTAVSQRLRRGLRRLLDDLLADRGANRVAAHATARE